MLRLVAYLKSSEANTHDVHICGSVVVVVGIAVLGSRMVCSDSKSTAQWCVMRVMLLAAGTASRKRKSCALPYDGQLLAVALLRQTRVCRAVPPSGKSQMARFLMTTPPKPKVYWSSAVVRLCGAVRAPRRRSRRARISSEESYVFAFPCDARPGTGWRQHASPAPSTPNNWQG